MRIFVRTLIVLVTLLAILLGGSVDLPAQTKLAALAGLFLLLAPPRGPLPRTPLVLAGLLLLIALTGFLPAPSFDSAAWRHYLVVECHIDPGTIYGVRDHGAPYVFPFESTWSPQPWLTLQGCGLLFLGLAWALYLLALPWEREDRIRAGEVLVFGVAFLAMLAALAFVLHLHIPGWDQEQNRGWFPNRNQTADVLALCGIVTYALIFDRLRKGKTIGYLLLVALVPIVTELIISYSRAGIVLFFGGVLAWHFWPRPAGVKRGASLKWIALPAALLILLFAVFLTWGGDTLTRFQRETSASTMASDFTDFRGAIQEDALRFSFQSPILGTGLGNFEPLFSFSRIDSINANRAIHPESDWLWLACEMGWLAVIIIVGGYVWWVRRVLPMENKPGESMRRALVVAVFLFAVHGLVDVSGHRAGSLFVALLIAAMALPARADEQPSPATPRVFRGLGCALLLLAGWWYASLHAWPVPPTTGTLARLKASLSSGKLTPVDATRTATTALRIAPLDWSLYVLRGTSEINQDDQIDRAEADFATARALNPYWIALAIDEGRALSTIGQPDLALDAWRDGLRRSGPLAKEQFRQMVGLVQLHSIERQGLALLAYDNLDYFLILLPTSPVEEAKELIDHLLKSDPTLHRLTAEQRKQLFSAWWTQGNQVQLMEIIHEHPEWNDETWLYQARFAADESDFQHACEILFKNVRPPIIPQSTTAEPLGDLAADFASHPNDLNLGLALLLAQVKQGDSEAAIKTIAALVKIPGYPPYLNYIDARMFAQRGDWQPSWKAWQFYLQP